MPKPTLLMPSPLELQVALAQIRADYAQRRDIHTIELMFDGRTPVVVFYSTAPAASAVPSAYRIRLKDGSRYNLRIVWRHAAKPADHQMWGGGTVVTPRMPHLLPQTDSRAPVVNDSIKIPEADGDNYQIWLPVRKPQWVRPNFWAKPLEISATVCVPFYETWYNVIAHLVPATSMFVITGVSYEFNNCLQLFDQFEVKVTEDGFRAGQFFDMYASKNVDPAYQFAFGGHVTPIPFFLIADHDRTVTAQVRVHGQFPFANLPTTPLGGCCTIYLHGFSSHNVLASDSGGRPSDTGDDGTDDGDGYPWGSMDLTPHGAF